jgi:hypothetical protein
MRGEVRCRGASSHRRHMGGGGYGGWGEEAADTHFQGGNPTRVEQRTTRDKREKTSPGSCAMALCGTCRRSDS